MRSSEDPENERVKVEDAYEVTSSALSFNTKKFGVRLGEAEDDKPGGQHVDTFGELEDRIVAEPIVQAEYDSLFD